MIASIEKLSPSDGDIVLLRGDFDVEPEKFAESLKEWKEKSGKLNILFIVIPSDVKFEALDESELERIGLRRIADAS